MFGGDLNVSAGATYTIAPPSGHMTYYAAGNINVAKGGTLTVTNTTVVFDNFIGDNGSAANRLAHVFALDDAGTVVLQNSTITTLVNQVNPFCSLSLAISGLFKATNSSLEFPGAIVVSGASGDLWLRGSTIAPNPSVASTFNTGASGGPAFSDLVNASRYAPSIEVIGGAQASLLDSVENGTFALNYSEAQASGLPVSTNSAGGTIGVAGMPPAALAGTPVAPLTLGLASVFPTVESGRLSVQYSAGTTTQSAGSSFNYNGAWALPTINFPASTGGTVTVPLPATVPAAINASGVAAYLAALDSGDVSVTFGPSANAVTVSSIAVSWVTWDYNLTVSGPGTVLTAADTSFDMNWSATPGLAPPAQYYPSNSSKIVLQGGATAFLANISVSAPLPANYLNQSFVQPQDAASTANFYRWLDVPVEGARAIPIEGASVQPYYAFPAGNSSFNVTANSLSALASADPALAQYASSVATSAGAPAYGESGDTGVAALLLPSTTLTNLSLPDGNALADYHLGVTAVPGNPSSVQWTYASVPPYPVHMASRGGNATGPTVASAVSYPTYQPIINAGNPTIADALTPIVNHTIAVGQNVTILEQVNNTGTAPVTSMNVTITFSQYALGSGGKPGNLTDTTIGSVVFGPLAPGSGRTLEYNWTVDTDSLILLPPVPPGGFIGWFTAEVSWSPGSGTGLGLTNVTVVPPYISFSATGTVGNLVSGGAYTMTASIGYPTTLPVTMYLNVTAVGPAGSYDLAIENRLTPGDHTLSFPLESTIQPGTYTVQASIYCNGRTVWSNITSAFTVPAPASSSSTAWYEQSILGLPLWLLLVIVIAAVGAVVGFLLFARLQAKGKVVECGECGAMIPEDATSCRNCGAEFESDRVRCSRCGSTIPANSQVCPECSATLLGKETEEKLDPERQGYADFVERFRVEGKKVLGDSYSDSAFWDWWKRQSSFVSFGQWKLQQAQTSRAGMTAPKETPRAATPPARAPGAPSAAGRTTAPPAPKAASTPPPPPEEPAPPEQPAPAEMITCPNCGKQVPAGYLVCTFCGAVTQ
jgi:hypothetical protein